MEHITNNHLNPKVPISSDTIAPKNAISIDDRYELFSSNWILDCAIYEAHIS